MTLHRNTLALIESAHDILTEHNPMTVRQVYYQLVSRLVCKNSRAQYQAVSSALVMARLQGIIPWGWIEDRLRRPRTVPMWSNTKDFADTALRSYRRDTWATQPNHVELWLEKDALSALLERTAEPYGVTLNVGRGYDGWDSIHKAAWRFGDGAHVFILYFGDFDPSGEDMFWSIGERLEYFGCHPSIIKCALTSEDIDRYGLPPDFTKTTDARSKNFVEKHGDISVELDALPPDVLRQRIVAEIENLIDLDALAVVREREDRERERLRAVFAELAPDQ